MYQIRVISKSTYEHYNKIRIIGNKATHEGDNNAYNANTAYHLLSQEVFTFSNDYSPRKKFVQNQWRKMWKVETVIEIRIIMSVKAVEVLHIAADKDAEEENKITL